MRPGARLFVRLYAPASSFPTLLFQPIAGLGELMSSRFAGVAVCAPSEGSVGESVAACERRPLPFVGMDFSSLQHALLQRVQSRR